MADRPNEGASNEAGATGAAIRFRSARPRYLPGECRSRHSLHIEGDGATVFRHVCKLGLEGIVPKRKDAAYRSGRSPDWLKRKNPGCGATVTNRCARAGRSVFSEVELP